MYGFNDEVLKVVFLYGFCLCWLHSSLFSEWWVACKTFGNSVTDPEGSSTVCKI